MIGVWLRSGVLRMSWRGRGGGRRGYGGHRGHRGGRRDDYDRPSSSSAGSSYHGDRAEGARDSAGGGGGYRGRGGGRGGGPPRGLRGRDIGMWFAQRSRAKKREKDIQDRGNVGIEQGYAQYLEGLVSDMPDAESHGAHAMDAQQTSDPGKWFKAGLERNPRDDQAYLDELNDMQSDREYQHLGEFRRKLPSWSQQEEIIRTIDENRVTVISGETGCGKTTQVPQFILDDFIRKNEGSLCRVVCTQPRRISAITVAERVAKERGHYCGSRRSSTGYQIRLETKFPRDSGSILYCTTGIVLKWLESNPNLNHVSHLVIDEIHERDLLSDFLMIVLKDVMRNNPNIRVILMSATLNAEKFSKYYNNAAMIHIPGFTFPVKEFYTEDIIEWLRYVPRKQARSLPLWVQRKRGKKSREELMDEQQDFDAYLRHLGGRFRSDTIETLRNMDYEEIDLDLVCELIERICVEKPEGAILVFLPGWEQISNVHKQLQGQRMFQSNHLLLPLHSMMPTVNQKEVFDRPPPGTRKIVLATNIAETSITIDDVVYVIDCGKIKIKNYDSELNIMTLQPEWNSLANSRQRRGRAGRVQPGECYHLYTTYHEAKFESYQKPEILRTRLEELCLQIKLLNLGKIKDFVLRAMDAPDEQTLDQSISLLKQLNALTESENLTPLGHHLSRLPVDPHAGKMILFGAMFSCLDPITTIAASLSFKDAFVIPLGKEAQADKQRRLLSRGSKSDHIMLVNAFQGWEDAKRRGRDSQYCWDNFLSQSTLKMLANMKNQFTDLLYDAGFVQSRDPKHPDANRNSGNDALIKAVVCSGLYPNVAKIYTRQTKRGPIHKMTTKEGQKVKFHKKCINVEEKDLGSQWLVYHLIMKTNGINIFDSTPVSPFSLLFFGGQIEARTVDREDCVVVDKWIVFRAERRVAELVKELRSKLDSILSNKIRNPGMVVWDEKSVEGNVMKAIEELVTKDYSGTTVNEETGFIPFNRGGSGSRQSSWDRSNKNGSQGSRYFQRAWSDDEDDD